MRILVSAYACFPNSGSENGNGWNLPIELARRGHEVVCLTTALSREPVMQALASFDGEQRPEFEFIDLPSANCRSLRCLPEMARKRLDYRLWQRRALRAARRICCDRPFDIVHHITLGSLHGGSCLWRLGVPMVFGPVGGGQRAPEALRSYLAAGRWEERCRDAAAAFGTRFDYSLRCLMHTARAVLVSNPETHRLAVRVGALHVHDMTDAVLPDAYFPPAIPERAGGGPLRLLWVGTLLPRKGLLLVLDALARVPATVPYHLTIVGGGPLTARLPGWLQSFGLRERVTHHAAVPWEAVREMYRDHDAFVFCSLRDSVGVQLLEAMAFGLPIIALNHQGAAQLVPADAGIKIAVGDAAGTARDIAQAVVEMARAAERRRRWGEIAFARAKELSWSNRIREFERIYQQITGMR